MMVRNSSDFDSIRKDTSVTTSAPSTAATTSAPSTAATTELETTTHAPVERQEPTTTTAAATNTASITTSLIFPQNYPFKEENLKVSSFYTSLELSSLITHLYSLSETILDSTGE
jgi:hypothetical protein